MQTIAPPLPKLPAIWNQTVAAPIVWTLGRIAFSRRHTYSFIVKPLTTLPRGFAGW